MGSLNDPKSKGKKFEDLPFGSKVILSHGKGPLPTQSDGLIILNLIHILDQSYVLEVFITFHSLQIWVGLLD